MGVYSRTLVSGFGSSRTCACVVSMSGFTGWNHGASLTSSLYCGREHSMDQLDWQRGGLFLRKNLI